MFSIFKKKKIDSVDVDIGDIDIVVPFKNKKCMVFLEHHANFIFNEKRKWDILFSMEELNELPKLEDRKNKKWIHYNYEKLKPLIENKSIDCVYIVFAPPRKKKGELVTNEERLITKYVFLKDSYTIQEALKLIDTFYLENDRADEKIGHQMLKESYLTDLKTIKNVTNNGTIELLLGEMISGNPINITVN